MLELKNIKKTYITGDEKVEALKGITLKFRESEFVSILGQSGCGKTTLLNIIGGLDRYTSGDLIINNKSTKKFKNRDWDAYRNYKIGFVFQSYNLISHQTVLSNVELALTIGGISKKERKERAIKALEEVGLKDHIHKKPNQLSGGQMQRVAIARALVNDPDIILADEPTGALDTKTSVQVMEILKKISKNKLIIMVTHNPELTEKYSSRIIRILDGKITEDSNPIEEGETQKQKDTSKIGRTSMKIWTAFRLSLNNLLTKKARTILVAFAGSIGIIGIALVQAVSNGFQAYVDSIQEETLTSYPLSIMEETTDITSVLLSMTTEDTERKDTKTVEEEQYISTMLESLSTNDLRSFKKYLEENQKEVEKDLSTVKYSYSVEPSIYTKDATGRIAKINPSNLFSGTSSYMSSFTSTFSQMIDNEEAIKNSYDILAGHLPEKYDEMIIVLSEPNTISDLLVYSLGLRDTEELKTIVTKIMSGETVDIHNEPLTFSYEDLMNIDLKLIMGTDTYKYNEKYDIYEDMTQDEEYLQNLYNDAIKLKIVGIVCPKEGTTSMMLSPGVQYTSDLIDYIIDYSKDKDIVKKQLDNTEVDVFSGSRFDEKNNNLDLNFQDLVSVDSKKLEDAFNVKIDQNDIQKQTEGYMAEISNSITTDTTPAKTEFTNVLNTLTNGIFDSIEGEFGVEDVDKIVSNYLDEYEPSKLLSSLEEKYVVPKDVFKNTYSELLRNLLVAYIGTYNSIPQMDANMGNQGTGSQGTGNTTGTTIPDEFKNTLTNQTQNENVNQNTIQNNTLNSTQSNAQSNTQNNTTQNGNPNKNEQNTNKTSKVKVNKQLVNLVVQGFVSNAAIEVVQNEMAKGMTEAVMQKEILTKVGELTSNLVNSFASAFNVDEEKIASAFQLKMTEDEITRIVTAMMSDTQATAKTNLISLGYQDKEEPTYISFYFDSFEGKENFLNFLDNYNEKVKNDGEEDKVVNYTDATGILIDSVKTIVNAVTYVLIAFVSISLVVSSIMIGIITYISVYERTKEIGILRAIGASKGNISSIFNAETFIIGLLSGLFGIGISYALIPIINTVLRHFTGNIALNVILYPNNAIILVILSVILTLIGGLIPARSASKKDPVIALRTE